MPKLRRFNDTKLESSQTKVIISFEKGVSSRIPFGNKPEIGQKIIRTSNKHLNNLPQSHLFTIFHHLDRIISYYNRVSSPLATAICLQPK